MKEHQFNLRFSVVTLLILLAAASRLLPHPPNFSPLGGMALFGAAYYGRRAMAYLIPSVSMWISDLAVNNILYSQYFDRFVWFYSGAIFTYGAFLVIVVYGRLILDKIRLTNLAAAALGASVIFFLVSNFGVWLSSDMYPHSFSGLISCYAAGIPFLKNTLLGDLFYSGLLFGLFELSLKKIPGLQTQQIQNS
jgi:hypothetical protein